MGRGEEGGGAPGCCDPPPLLLLLFSLLLLPPFLPVYRLVKRRNKQKRAQRREDIPPSPPPRYLSIFIQPFLSWRGIIPLQASEIWGLGRDGVTTDRPKQGKPLWAERGHPHAPAGAPLCLTGSNNATGIAACASAFSGLHGAATWPPVSGSYSQPYCHSGEGRGMRAVSKMHGMRWKVNSDTETEERGETKGDGLLEAECVI